MSYKNFQGNGLYSINAGTNISNGIHPNSSIKSYIILIMFANKISMNKNSAYHNQPLTKIKSSYDKLQKK